MRLWAGPSTHFIRDVTHNQIAEKLRDAFFATYRYQPSPGEVNSWRNSLRATSDVFRDASLNDHGVLLEYQLPLTSRRLDCMVCGRDGAGRDQAVIIELKQWERAIEAVGEKMVATFVGGREREMLHPSVQVGQYEMYLEDAHTAFYEEPNPIGLSACSYLHNYFPEEGDILLADVFRPVLERNPLFSGDDAGKLKDYLIERLEAGEGAQVLTRVEESRYRPSKRLMDHVAGVIKERSEYILLDEQLVVYEKVLQCARTGSHDRKKNVLIIRGGPGTGKSVIAINLMADLLREEYNAQYATGSRAFTGTLRKIIGTRGAVQFKYFNSYVDAEKNAIDVLLCDEAHRIRVNSRSRYKPKADRPQIEELIDVARVSVFFIDERQGVKPDEIGSVAHIEEHAKKAGARVRRYQLEAQFRCEGSDGFVNWVDNTLGIAATANQIWSGDERFDFQIVPSIEELDRTIRRRSEKGHTARLAAGFCWKWSEPRPDGTLVKDVVVGDWRRPWNARSGKSRLAKGIPPETLWAHDPGGINQVGCIYTAQGFEFDYIGVIWGHDLRYDLDEQRWIGDPTKSADTQVKRGGDRFPALVKNTYRVLLSRGLKGCYVYFMDRDTERFVKTRMECPCRALGSAST